MYLILFICLVSNIYFGKHLLIFNLIYRREYYSSEVQIGAKVEKKEKRPWRHIVEYLRYSFSAFFRIEHPAAAGLWFMVNEKAKGGISFDFFRPSASLSFVSRPAAAAAERERQKNMQIENRRQMLFNQYVRLAPIKPCHLNCVYKFKKKIKIIFKKYYYFFIPTTKWKETRDWSREEIFWKKKEKIDGIYT